MSRLRRSASALVFAAVLGGVALSARQAQPDKGQRAEEEDPDFKPGRPVLKIEESESADRATRRFPRPAADLRQAAHDAKHPAVRQAYADLAVPYDLVIYRDKERPRERLRPVKHFVGNRPEALRDLTFDVVPLDPDGKEGKPVPFVVSTVESVRHYEQLAAASASELSRDAALPLDLRLAAAEQLLSVAQTFNESARSGDEWRKLGAALKAQMFDVLLAQLGEVRDWDEAVELTRRLTSAYPEPAQAVQAAGKLCELLGRAPVEANAAAPLREARRLARQLVEQYAGNDTSRQAADALRRQAQALFDQAQKEENNREAKDLLLAQAEDCDPTLPNLRDARAELNEDYPVLRVGVRELPQYLSPGRATTDSELRAVELQFESLVKVVVDPEGATYFAPGLAEGRPRVVPLGRQFLLPRRAAWSDDREIKSTDVRHSVELLKRGLAGRPAAYGDLLEDVAVVDPKRVTLSFKEGFLEPLSLMTFKILPDGASGEDEAFARKPVGSGPFKLLGGGKEAGRGDYVAFVSNPAYAGRSGKGGPPRVREVRFYVAADPVKDLKDGRLDLALDLTAAQHAALSKEPRVFAPPPGPNRRVWFLAVNHGTGPLANARCRRALSLAINRDELLNQHFRGGSGAGVHKSLNGPFPAGSWAGKSPVSGRGSLDPWDRPLAEQLFDETLGDRGGSKVKLLLKYPAGDDRLREVFADLRKQVLAASKDRLDLEPTPLDAHTLRADVENGRYDLAYWRYDYPDDTYWLGPLLGSRSAGENLLHYHDAKLQPLLQQAQARRAFEEVRERTRLLHGVLDTEVPLVPLWQLDALSAYREDLRPLPHDRKLTYAQRKDLERVPYDPLQVFPEIESWRLEK